MIKYTESTSSNESVTQTSDKLEEITDVKETPVSSAKDGSISLTRLWEYIVRSKRIPDDLDLNAFFSAINQRLRNPEWVVRQHALRVLVDIIPLIDKEALDTKVETVLNEVVRNLGHVGPAVRKGAVDALKIYLNNSRKPNSIFKELISKGVEHSQQNKVNTNISLGIIIAIPFLINSKITNEAIRYSVRVLLDRIGKAVHQESILRSLLRTKGIIGARKFDGIVDAHKSRREFEMLCELYNLPEPNLNLSAGDMFYATDNKHFWNDHNQNLINSSFENGISDCDEENKENLMEDRVILETEIKLEAGPAITMQIHEESRQNSTNDTSDSEDDTRGIRTFKVLTDSEDEYEILRRTPRRVRFGGEIVKMRTPDSDSNHQSDDDPTLSIKTKQPNSVIEIHYKTTKITNKSQIPIPVTASPKSVKSEPSSPKRVNTSKLYKSSPNLSKIQSGRTEKVSTKSRIPKRNENERNEIRSIKIKVNNIVKKEPKKDNVCVKNEEKKNAAKEQKKTDKVEKKDSRTEEIKENPKPSNQNHQVEKKVEKDESKTLLAIEFHPKQRRSVTPNSDRLSVSPNSEREKSKSPKPLVPKKSNKDTETFTPIPVHNEIEVFHNLTRSPERKQSSKKDQDRPNDRHLTTADDVFFGNTKLPSVNAKRRIQTADVHINDNDSTGTTNNQLVFINSYNSFHVYNSSSVSGQQSSDFADSPIPTRDTGECLTCSSSGSDIMIEKNVQEQLGKLSEKILADIQCRDDIRVKQRGLEELLKVLQDPDMLESVEERLFFLLHLLFSAEQHPFLQSIAEQNLAHILTNIREEVLMSKLHHIALYLSKTGSPVGVRLAMTILKRIPTKHLNDHLLSDSILVAKSSKVREGGLQILMSISRIFPSTEMDIPKCVSSVIRVMKDRKRKVRQAALETLAALTQLSSTSIVLDIVYNIIQDYPDREQILRVIRTRLSRKQLPAVDVNGNVRYSTPSGESEIEWLAKGSNGSPIEGNSKFVENHRTNDLQVENSSDEKTNYWKGTDRNTQNDILEQSVLSDDNESDWSRDSKDESKTKSAPQIWAIDPTVFTASEKLTSINGTLRPVYVIKSTESQSTNISSDSQHIKTNKQTNTELHQNEQRGHRGRSFSPPKRQRNLYAEQERFVTTNGTRQSNIYRNERFHKSFSSDQLVPERHGQQTNSFSSGSSSTTSGSSFRGGIWNVRSGIPVPISSDSRFRFRTKCNDTVKGPMSTNQFYSSKLQTPEATPEKYSSPPKPLMARQPFSSGSESSGYFTPPAEPQLPDNNNVDRSSTENIPNAATRRSAHSETTSINENRFVRSGTPTISPHHQENFTVIDSNYCESLKSKSATSTKSAYVEHRFDSVDYQGSREDLDSPREQLENKKDTFENDEEEEEIVKEIYVKSEENIVRRGSSAVSLEDLDYIANQTFGERRNLSKSQLDIKVTPENQRKTVYSAPSLNETTFTDFEKFDTPISSAKTSLPGSIVDFQEIEVVQEVIEKNPDKTICKKTITRQLSRRRSLRMPNKTETSSVQESARPFAKPKEALSEILNQLDSGEWEVTIKGLQSNMRLIKHHPNIIEQNIHAVCVGVGRHVRNLRSQVARSACLATAELFKTCKRALEPEIEELATPLLHRTADTNRFLRGDANDALDEMCNNFSPPKVVNVLTTKGADHQNAIVRCTAVRLLYSLCHRLGSEKVFQLPKDTRDRILLTGANMLMEGSLETRKHAKMLLGYLSNHAQFQRAMLEAVPSQVMRHISKTLKTLT